MRGELQVQRWDCGFCELKARKKARARLTKRMVGNRLTKGKGNVQQQQKQEVAMYGVLGLSVTRRASSVLLHVRNSLPRSFISDSGFLAALSETL